MRWAFLSIALLTSACTFSAERPLFSASDAAYPIADGARMEMREAAHLESEPTRIIVRRAAEGGYEFVSADPADDREAMHVLFVAVPETPAEDYIIQARLDPGEAGVAFAFAWRTPNGFRVLTDPDELDAIERLDPRCERLAYGECRLATPEAVRAIARDLVAPAFIEGGRVSESAIDLVAID
ncbi:MAG: hypothetical protein AB7O04_13990 [Hyphomonadaceae bacterium]